jgi:hypothetical protein
MYYMDFTNGAPTAITVYHKLGLSVWIAVGVIVVVILFCTFYPMMLSYQASSTEPPPPEKPFSGYVDTNNR